MLFFLRRTFGSTRTGASSAAASEAVDLGLRPPELDPSAACGFSLSRAVVLRRCTKELMLLVTHSVLFPVVDQAVSYFCDCCGGRRWYRRCWLSLYASNVGLEARRQAF